jgi:hypothetical protein|nr:MAG TPA: hypothetical protein [Caudoviricetes sp.]
MERLTKLKNGRITYNEKRDPVFECGEFCDNCPTGTAYCRTMKEMIRKLATYEDLEEQGLLVRLPCKVGDTVWVVTSPINVFGYDEYDGDAEYEVYESFLSSVSYYASGEQFRIYAKVTNSFIAAYFRKCDFGESIFLTREDAEKKLEEIQNDKA